MSAPARTWSDAEDAILAANRPQGRVRVKAALLLAGYDRSLDQIKGRVAILKRRAQNANRNK